MGRGSLRMERRGKEVILEEGRDGEERVGGEKV